MKKKTKKRRVKKPAVEYTQLLPFGLVRRKPPPRGGRWKTMVTLLRNGDKEMADIEWIRDDPYDMGHTIWKLIQSLSVAYGEGVPSTEALGLMLASIIDHSEGTLMQLMDDVPPVEVVPTSKRIN